MEFEKSGWIGRTTNVRYIPAQRALVALAAEAAAVRPISTAECRHSARVLVVAQQHLGASESVAPRVLVDDDGLDRGALLALGKGMARAAGGLVSIDISLTLVHVLFIDLAFHRARQVERRQAGVAADRACSQRRPRLHAALARRRSVVGHESTSDALHARFARFGRATGVARRARRAVCCWLRARITRATFDPLVPNGYLSTGAFVTIRQVVVTARLVLALVHCF
mmetsp:Transcript_12284/g.33225  ORF Transcript_12284/g.33225 Transcript_12284/m.33225 type:complete len:226 (+) Transcript_12284:2904-3581(+)